MADKELVDSAVAENVVALFAPEPNVAEIYVHQNARDIKFWIFTSDAVYDDALMRRMIGYEWQIKRSVTVTVEFEFIPLALCEDVSDVLDDKPLPVYRKVS